MEGTMKTMSKITCALFCVVATSCGGSPGVDTGDQGDPSLAVGAGTSKAASSTTGIRGTLLYKRELGRNVIEFFEFDSGGTAVKETFDSTKGEALLAGVDKEAALADTYRALQPDKPVPQVLINADARAAAEAQAQAQSPQANMSPLAATAHADSEAATPSKHATATGAPSCSPDNYGDAWGAQWFVNTQCNNGYRKVCGTNYGTYDSGLYTTGRSSVQSLEGDFWNAGSLQIYHESCILWSCTQSLDVWETVNPRQFSTYWKFGGAKFRVVVWSPCGHAHFVLSY
jgi:hypothetical protein